MEYYAELTRAMEMLGGQPETIFLGQAIAYPGTGMTKQFCNVPTEKLWEMPVCEELQLGMCLGLVLDGYIPISVLPRWNFLILAANQLVNHIDKWALVSGVSPKIIIKVGVGSIAPLFPGDQHIGDFTDAFRLLCPNIHITTLTIAEDILPAYLAAYQRHGPSLLVEYADLYR